jgi:hypothetical protein
MPSKKWYERVAQLLSFTNMLRSISSLKIWIRQIPKMNYNYPLVSSVLLLLLLVVAAAGGGAAVVVAVRLWRR